MKTEAVASPVVRSSHGAIAWTILGIGLIAGTLDITDNLIYNVFRSITPDMVFRYIASGLLGVNLAARLGIVAVLIGALLHYFIALSWTVLFYEARRRLSLIRSHPIFCGLLYGGIVYLVMNLLVVPLSAVPHLHRHIGLAARINAVLAVVLFIGLTVSLLFAYVFRRSEGPISPP